MLRALLYTIVCAMGIVTMTTPAVSSADDGTLNGTQIQQLAKKTANKNCRDLEGPVGDVSFIGYRGIPIPSAYQTLSCYTSGVTGHPWYGSFSATGGLDRTNGYQRTYVIWDIRGPIVSTFLQLECDRTVHVYTRLQPDGTYTIGARFLPLNAKNDCVVFPMGQA